MKKALTSSIFAPFRAHFRTPHAFLIAPFHPLSRTFCPPPSCPFHQKRTPTLAPPCTFVPFSPSAPYLQPAALQCRTPLVWIVQHKLSIVLYALSRCFFDQKPCFPPNNAVSIMFGTRPLSQNLLTLQDSRTLLKLKSVVELEPSLWCSYHNGWQNYY